MARRRTTEGPVGESHDEIIDWYWDRLNEPAKVPWTKTSAPVLIGPTWKIRRGRWVLPEASLGWDVLGWCGTWLQLTRGEPWRFTLEQARWLLWWYALTEDGTFVYHDGVLQRLKGWGKDPLAACLDAVEAFGPCRFAGWEDDVPVALDVEDAWVQVAAVSLEQTKNTMRLFPGLFTAEARKRFRIQIGKEKIHGLGDRRLIEAVTSAPNTLEGARSTFVEKNETHHWLANNDGHGMADVIERNQAKSPDGGARSLAITNAFEPGEDSSAQHDREAWEAIEAGRSKATGLLYDSVEANPKAKLTARAAPRVVVAIRGDSTWLSPDRIVKSILDPRNPPSRSRRYWYNQITAAEDAWVEPREWDAAADPALVIPGGTVITIGFDGSISDDHTALIGCDVEEDHLFEIEVWEPGESGEIDRLAVDQKVRETFAAYDVVGFYSDLYPFESYVDQWAIDFGPDLIVKPSPRHAVAFDIRARTKEFTDAVERLHAAIVESAKTNADQRLTHCGSERFRQHVHNARRAPNPWGISIRKEHRESARKIDSVPAAVLARRARQDYLALPPAKRKRKRRSGRVFTA